MKNLSFAKQPIWHFTENRTGWLAYCNAPPPLTAHTHVHPLHYNHLSGIIISKPFIIFHWIQTKHLISYIVWGLPIVFHTILYIHFLNLWKRLWGFVGFSGFFFGGGFSFLEFWGVFVVLFVCFLISTPFPTFMFSYFLLKMSSPSSQ